MLWLRKYDNLGRKEKGKGKKREGEGKGRGRGRGKRAHVMRAHILYDILNLNYPYSVFQTEEP